MAFGFPIIDQFFGNFRGSLISASCIDEEQHCIQIPQHDGLKHCRVPSPSRLPLTLSATSRLETRELHGCSQAQGLCWEDVQVVIRMVETFSIMTFCTQLERGFICITDEGFHIILV